MWGMAKAWGTALDFIFTIIAGGALGYGWDYWKKTAPTGLMIGLAIGFVVAFIRIVRSTLKEEREETRRKAESRGK
jgi:F0F1-type ATP synthase assembly protein I